MRQGLLTVAIGGMGAIGYEVAKALDRGIGGLRLVAVSARDTKRLGERIAGFKDKPACVDLEALADADVVIEAMPAESFDHIALPAIARGRVFMPCSVGALLSRMPLIEQARVSGARIVVPTGALLGLDAVRAAAEGQIAQISIETRKPPRALEGAPYLAENGIEVSGIEQPICVFDGNAAEAATAFPANVNVAAALALAGVGPERTRVQVWADPRMTRNVHTVRVEADAARFTMTIEGSQSVDNPRTGQLAPLSVIACLRGLVSPFRVGS
jgi:aspartate dehydrogenase